MLVKKVTYFGEFGYLNSSCIRKSIILMFLSSSRDKSTLLWANSVTDVSVGFQPPCWSPSGCFSILCVLRRFWQIADRKKFYDRLRSYGNALLRSSAINCDCAIIWKLKFCDLRSKRIPQYSEFRPMIQRFLATKPKYSFVWQPLIMAGAELGNVCNEEYMEEVARYECVYRRNSNDQN